MSTPSDALPTRFMAIPPTVVTRCSPIIRADHNVLGAWRGALVFGLTSDERGHLTDVCVAGGNFGNVTEYVDCVAREVKQRAVLAPNLERVLWTLVYIVD